MAHEQTSRHDRVLSVVSLKSRNSSARVVRLVPIADIEHQAQPLLRCPSWEQSDSVTSFGASSPTCVLSVAGFCGQAHRGRRAGGLRLTLAIFGLLLATR